MDFLKFKELYHHGIKGQKWGVRRFQNEDGTLTTEGKKRYLKETVFISGSSKTTTPDQPYYRKDLPKDITDELDNIMKNKHKIVIGDAPGIDSQIQDYLNKHNYEKVTVYGPDQIRYLSNKNWKTKPIDSSEYEKMGKEWLAKKDIAMTKVSTKGLAIILDEGSKATRNNIDRLINQNKSVSIYELSKDGPNKDHWIKK